MERFVDQLPERLMSRDTDNYRAGFVGSGPIASAPPAGNYPAGVMLWDNVTGSAYQSNGVEWVGVGVWLTVNGEFVTLNGQMINVDDYGIMMSGVNSLVVCKNDLIIGAI